MCQWSWAAIINIWATLNKFKNWFNCVKTVFHYLKFIANFICGNYKLILLTCFVYQLDMVFKSINNGFKLFSHNTKLIFLIAVMLTLPLTLGYKTCRHSNLMINTLRRHVLYALL